MAKKRDSKTPLALYLLLIFLIGLPQAGAESRNSFGELREGITLFGRGDLQRAILNFRNLIFDPDADAYQADAYLWIAKSYMAINQLDDAERNLEHYLANYPAHPDYPEAYYHKGRLLVKQGEPESAIQLLQDFNSRYPDSQFIPNAYFWIGESLYLLGKLDEASVLFNRVLSQYPRSFKVEAARYRLSLIDFKKRELELLKLLKWSHEESLKTMEEFKRREKTYEQAIATYQRRLSGVKQEELSEQADSEQLLAEIKRLKDENTALQEQVGKLQEQVSAVERQGADALEAERLQYQQFQVKLEMLKLKEEALVLKESLLRQLEQAEESP